MRRIVTCKRASWSIIIFLLITLLSVAMTGGCGGGRGSLYTPPSSQLFVPNYIADLTGLYHWDNLPVTVRINLPSDWNALYPSDMLLYKKAVDEWNQEGRQTMLSIVPEGQSADITVHFVKQNELGGSVCGLTDYTVDSYGRMLSAKVRVALYTTQNTLVAPADLSSILAHELGHGLGIVGHSTNTYDLMYSTHFFGTSQTASIRDLNTAMSAYPEYFSSVKPTGSASHEKPAEIFRSVIE